MWKGKNFTRIHDSSLSNCSNVRNFTNFSLTATVSVLQEYSDFIPQGYFNKWFNNKISEEYINVNEEGIL